MREPSIPSWWLEPWLPDETETLFDVHRQAKEPLVEQVWGWNNADQRLRVRHLFNPKIRTHHDLVRLPQSRAAVR
ncbi:hypothetical protein BH20CHL2_BH20CHL2_09210 [soil metagenome]